MGKRKQWFPEFPSLPIRWENWTPLFENTKAPLQVPTNVQLHEGLNKWKNLLSLIHKNKFTQFLVKKIKGINKILLWSSLSMHKHF